MATEPAAPVVIVGGGFGGLYTALALAEVRHHQPILLIEPQERFVFLPLLYELLSHELRSWEVAPRYDTVLAGRGIAWLQDRVTAINAAERSLTTASGRRLRYSQAVIATGSTTQTFGIPGAAEHCLAFRSLADVQRLQQLIATLRQRRRPLQRLAVVGAGASGVELACKLADELAGSAVIELLEQGPTVLPQARSFNREQALLALQRRDVRVRTNTAVLAVGADHLTIGPTDETLPVDGTIWTAGLRMQLSGMGQQRPGLTHEVEAHVGQGDVLLQHRGVAAPLRQALRQDQAGVGDAQHVAHRRNRLEVDRAESKARPAVRRALRAPAGGSERSERGGRHDHMWSTEAGSW